MAEPELPLFEVRTTEDAEEIEEKIEEIQDYVGDIEVESILPNATEQILNQISNWITYALGELNAGSERFIRTSDTWVLLLDMKYILHILRFDVDQIITNNNKLKDKNEQVNGR
ncbi:hypothetical protein F4776DRAFT_612477 [Hypoxylon sp. NC0597]|nr:hypothetical protein F4776DRAFT_612477 [Hypoxylon sp. NC0597]